MPHITIHLIDPDIDVLNELEVANAAALPPVVALNPETSRVTDDYNSLKTAQSYCLLLSMHRLFGFRWLLEDYSMLMNRSSYQV